MIMNNYHIADLVIGYTHACLITDIQCITVVSLSNYLSISPNMLAQLMMDYTKASDLYDTALECTNLSYTEDNLSYGSWVV